MISLMMVVAATTTSFAKSNKCGSFKVCNDNMQFGSRIWIIVPFTQGKGSDISYGVGYCYITCRRIHPQPLSQ